MRRHLTFRMLVAALTVVLALGIVLVACSDTDTKTPASKGVARPENVFTNNIDKTDGVDLAKNAVITATSNADGIKDIVTDGNSDTAWTAANEEQTITVTFDAPTKVNTIVLRENGNYITSFRFRANGEEFYRQDRMERYRFCSFDEVEATSFEIVIDGANEGREISVSEIEMYCLDKTAEYADRGKHDRDFMVTSYYTLADYRRRTTFEYQLGDQLDVITDVILFDFAYWNEKGEVTYAQHDPDKDEDVTGDKDTTDNKYDPSLLKEVIAYVKQQAGENDVRICLDLYPTDKSNAAGLYDNLDKTVDSIYDMMIECDIDGIDFDWEYPANPDEWNAYGEMMRKLREKLDANGHTDRYVSVALSNFNVSFTKEQIAAIDYVQIMGYDRFDYEGNNASFRSGAYLPMRYFVNLGFAPDQLIAGLPAYGRPSMQIGTIWTDYNYKESTYTLNGKTYTTYMTGANDGEFGYFDNLQIIHNYNNNGSVIEEMPVFVTGGQMTADKTAYAIAQGFAGVMVFRGFEDVAPTSPISIIGAIGRTIDARIA